MLPLALGALSSSIDALLGSSSSSSSSSKKTDGRKFDPFDMFGSQANGDKTGSTPIFSSPQISPQTMRALLAVQNQIQQQSAQSQTSNMSTRSTEKYDPLQNLFSLIDGNGDGKVTKSEFENALGAGGTNLSKADEVFGKLDANADESVTLDELGSALKGSRGHRHAGGGSGSDPMSLSGATSSQTTNADGTTTTTLTFADGSKVTMTSAPQSSSAATSSYNFIEKLIDNQAKKIASQMSNALTVSA